MPPQNENAWMKILDIPIPNVQKGRLLLYLWRLVPGTTDSLHYPRDEIKQGLYEMFLEVCEDTVIPGLFRSLFKSHGYPFATNNTLATNGGQAWARCLSLSAITLHVAVKDAKTKTKEQICVEVKQTIQKRVFDEWPPIMDTMFKQGCDLQEAVLKDEEGAKAKGPQRLDGEPDEISYPF